MQATNSRAAAGGGNREMAAVGPPGAGAPHLIFPRTPLMMPPGIPLPIGGPFPGGVPPALLPGAFALHHAAVAGAAAGAAAAEEARKAHERSIIMPPNDGLHPVGVHVGPQRGGRGPGGRGSGSKRHGVERSSQSWRRQGPDEGTGSTIRSQRGRAEWRGGGPRGGGPGGNRWRGGQAEGGSGTLKKRQRVVDGGPHGGSDSELSLMSVASDEQNHGRRSPSVEFMHRQGPSKGNSHAGADNVGELSAVLTPMSSVSRSSRDSSLSRTSSPTEGPEVLRGVPPLDLAGASAACNNSSVRDGGVTPEWPPGLGVSGGPLQNLRPQAGSTYRMRSPAADPPPGCVAESVAGSVPPTQQNQKRIQQKRAGKFLFDLWVPTTFHPMGKDAVKAVLGVRGSTHKEMERVAGAHVQIYGKQLNRNTKKHEYDEFRDNQPLHLVVTSDRLRNPNPTPDEQLQIVHRLQNMLEGLVRENWPASAGHTPHSFFEKQQCLGPSTGPLVEVNPLDGTCHVLRQGLPSLRVAAGAGDSGNGSRLHGEPPQQRRPDSPCVSEVDELVAGEVRHPMNFVSQRGALPPPQQQLIQQSADKNQQQQVSQTVPWGPSSAGPHHLPAGSVGRAYFSLSKWDGDCTFLFAGVRFQGDPTLLLDLPPSMCLLMLTLQGLHALLAEEGPCSPASLPSRFVQKWDVPLKVSKAEYGLDASCPLSWSDSVMGLVMHFPEVFMVVGDTWGASGETGEGKEPTVSSVEVPQFRAVAARMRQLMAS
ncbi:uncharacterized protein LOC34617944 [Cyclospora cayetanensis]|uniref:Uncharacterized protein LOC34617944 n=1 Tax=Cyclospora cayetanensis TaxID=88456 RepID=A0A6P6RV74_9EIME|nr:uncharacterized protein LOC34617944 [Cyclospora cayetanensis]